VHTCELNRINPETGKPGNQAEAAVPVAPHILSTAEISQQAIDMMTFLVFPIHCFRGDCTVDCRCVSAFTAADSLG